MYAFSFLFPPDKIEEAQKELNGAEVSKKGKKKPVWTSFLQRCPYGPLRIEAFPPKVGADVCELGQSQYLSPHCLSPTHVLMLAM